MVGDLRRVLDAQSYTYLLVFCDQLTHLITCYSVRKLPEDVTVAVELHIDVVALCLNGQSEPDKCIMWAPRKKALGLKGQP